MGNTEKRNLEMLKELLETGKVENSFVDESNDFQDYLTSTNHEQKDKIMIELKKTDPNGLHDVYTRIIRL